MKIFIIAFACEPNRPSEPGLGWSIVGELAQRHDLAVLTRANNRDIIEQYLKMHPKDPHNRISWMYYDLAEWFHKLKKKLPGGIQLYHEIWQWRAAKKFKDAFDGFDIVHHLIFGGVFCTPWAAKYAKKFVWGPVGGALGAMEPPFLKRESRSSFLSEWFYGKVSNYSYRPLPFVRRLRNRAKAVMFRTSELAKRLSLPSCPIRAVVPESAYEGDVLTRAYRKDVHPLRMVSVGRLVPLKGLYYTIKAFAKYIQQGGKGEYHIYGDGPLSQAMEGLARSEGIAESVLFHGNVPHGKVLEMLASCDVLLHGSFREGASWAILEGMANGLPVICQARAGMVDMVPAECGTPISANTPEDLIEAMSSAMMRYYNNPELIKQHGVAGGNRVRQIYRWNYIADAICDVYSQVEAL